ncbi:type II toxin-antitoxin system HicB family antitoxin [Oscillospiraceae bacterium 50-58]
MMKLVYPALFSPWEDGSGFTVEVPDLPGCVTEGYSLADAIHMAEDAACGWLLTELEQGKPIPSASAIQTVVPEEGDFVSLVALDMDAYTEKYGKKAVRKNLTIPAWLNTFAEDQRINFSKVLTDALISLYEQDLSAPAP